MREEGLGSIKGGIPMVIVTPTSCSVCDTGKESNHSQGREAAV